MSMSEIKLDFHTNVEGKSLLSKELCSLFAALNFGDPYFSIKCQLVQILKICSKIDFILCYKIGLVVYLLVIR